MAEIVNLRRHRKRKERDRKSQAAAENRTRFGRTKAERSQEAASRKQEDRKLDGDRCRLPATAPACRSSPSSGTPCNGLQPRNRRASPA